MKTSNFMLTTCQLMFALALSMLLLGCGSGGGDRAGLGNSGKFNVSGSVSGASVLGVTITLTGGKTPVTATTDANGSYSLTGLVNGNYTITPVKSGFIFSPSSTAITVSGADVSDSKFVSTANIAATFALSGAVINAVTENVLITLSGQGNATTRTNAGGNYSFTGLLNGNYTATPSLDGFSFSPTTAQATINNANATFSNFISTVAQAATFSISGTVSGDTKQGVTVSLNGTSVTANTITDVNGAYSFGGLTKGSYTVSTSKTGFTFNPNSTTVSVDSVSINGVNFSAISSVAITYTLTGKVTGAVTNGVLITLSGSASGTTTSNASGNYTFLGLANGTYTATPSLAGYTFTPTSAQATITNADASFNTFTSIAPTYNIAGSVSGATASGVTINLTGGATKSTITDASGSYSFSSITNGNYSVTPVKTGFTFSPTSVTLSINGSSSNGPFFTATSINKLMGGTIQGTPLNLTTAVTTLAGSGLAGSVDGSSSAASFNYPISLTTDGTNIFVADYFSQKIRKIVIATGVVSTLAGSDTAGSVDAVGIAASFNNPGGLTSDGVNLYVSDSYNYKIRKVVIATGAVSTVAGSGVSGAVDATGAAASFGLPGGITTDGTNLYLTDSMNNTIRKIVINSGVVTTIAGSGTLASVDGVGTAASFNHAAAITTDGINLFVTEWSTHKIRKIVIATGVVTTVAGTGVAGAVDGIGTAASFNSPNGIITDGTNLYISDQGGNKIRKVVIANWSVTTIAGSGVSGAVDGIGIAATFYEPRHMTSDGTNIYVADAKNNKIRKIK